MAQIKISRFIVYIPLGKGLVISQKTITASKKKKALALGKGFLVGILLVALNFARLL